MLKKIENFENYQTFVMRSVGKGAGPNVFRDIVLKGWEKPDVTDGTLTVFSGLKTRPPASK